MKKRIDHIINKYFEGLSTLEEEKILKDYLASEEVDSGYEYLKELILAKSSSVSSEISYDFLLDKSVQESDALLDKYFAGETSLGEEERLKFYFSSSRVKDAHKEWQPLFDFFAAQANSAEDLDYHFEVPTRQVSKEPRVRKMWPRAAAIAASFAILVIAGLNFNKVTAPDSDNLVQLQTEEEALEVTLEALAFLGHNYKKGTSQLRHVDNLNKADIFKFN